jgi:adenylate cyclase class IV
MPTNLELKVRVPNPESIEERLRSLEVDPPTVLHQTDTYFAVPKGRLKFRQIEGQTGELIQYSRNEAGGDRVCLYTVYPAGDELLELLKDALEVTCIVRKERTVYLYRHTRIHLDRVEHLGTFVELEVQGAENLDEAREEHDFLVEHLGLAECERIAGSYLDLLGK